MKLFKLFISIITSVLLFANVSLAEKWDMALAYGAGNFHSANATEFAKNVTEKSGGKLTIVTHPGGSLFKGGEIFRAVRTGQAPIGERFMSALGKEDPLYEIDSLPFLATTYDDAMKFFGDDFKKIEVIDPSGKLGSWLNACMLLSASISPAIFGWILLDQSLSEIYPYLMFFLLAAFVCIFITKRELEPIDKV